MPAEGLAWRVLPFGQKQVGPELFALCRAVPYLDHLLDWMDEHHGMVRGDAEVRHWHRALAEDGQFEIGLHQGIVTLRSGRAVMLANKTVVYGVQGRADLLLAASRPGFGHPLTAVLLPRERVVVQVCGAEWNVTAKQGAQAMALFAAHGKDCWADWLTGPRPTKLLVTGDANYAHHLWNQLGALLALLEGGGAFEIATTHQPVGLLADILADRPERRIHVLPPDALPGLDPMRWLPFPGGGTIVAAAARVRVQRVAAERATAASREALARVRREGRRPVWLTLRLQRTARNQLAALSDLAVSLLSDGRYAVVFDGYSKAHDFADNPQYDNDMVEAVVAREQVFVAAVMDAVAGRLGEWSRAFMVSAVGWDLLDSLFLGGHCAAYFANHGTLQHKLGYFTKVPGLVHANPAMLAINRAATHTYVIEDPGVVEYIDAGLVEDMPAAGGAAMHPGNNYRFTDIRRLVTVFRSFLQRYEIEANPNLPG